MKKDFNDSDQKLFDYLDGLMTVEEKKLFEESMRQSSALQKMVEEQRLLEGNLKTMRLAEPSSSFTNNVMSRIKESPQSYTLSMRNGILLLIGVMVVSFLAVMLLQSGVFDGTTALNMNNETGLVGKYIKQPLPNVSISGKWIVNIIVLINMVLGFIILDRAVLRPFFERRMRHS